MSHAHGHDNVGVPRPALLAMGALVLFALLATTWVRPVGRGHPRARRRGGAGTRTAV